MASLFNSRPDYRGRKTKRTPYSCYCCCWASSFSEPCCRHKIRRKRALNLNPPLLSRGDTNLPIRISPFLCASLPLLLIANHSPLTRKLPQRTQLFNPILLLLLLLPLIPRPAGKQLFTVTASPAGYQHSTAPLTSAV